MSWWSTPPPPPPKNPCHHPEPRGLWGGGRGRGTQARVLNILATGNKKRGGSGLPIQWTTHFLERTMLRLIQIIQKIKYDFLSSLWLFRLKHWQTGSANLNYGRRWYIFSFVLYMYIGTHLYAQQGLIVQKHITKLILNTKGWCIGMYLFVSILWAYIIFICLSKFTEPLTYFFW